MRNSLCSLRRRVQLVTVIRNGQNGTVDTRLDRLVEAMRELLNDPREAARQGANARATAYERFSIDRFVDDWLRVSERVRS